MQRRDDDRRRRRPERPARTSHSKAAPLKVIRPQEGDYKASHAQQPDWPIDWDAWVDEMIPDLVKGRYSPKETWKNKPFAKEDVRFFVRGIQELSDLFTQERPRDLPPYFRQPRFRSAYLLYFLPLQAAKFVLLFQQHKKAVDAALAHAKKTGTLRVLDLGAGPGTASFALLLVLLEQWKKDPASVPQIELLWVDTNPQALEDGRLLFEKFCEAHPELPLKERAKLRIEVGPWWQAPKRLAGEASLILMGNVLNEASDPGAHSRKEIRRNLRELGPDAEEDPHTMATLSSEWKDLLSVAGGGGILIVDPAARRSSQRLSRIRDLLLPEIETEDPRKTRIWGPCLHLGACPLAHGRDWCHFSFPIKVPGKWFREFSLGLGSERHWVKFSYLWIASHDYPAPVADRVLRRVISDPLGNNKQDVLLCEPETPKKHRSARNRDLRRGDVIKIH